MNEKQPTNTYLIPANTKSGALILNIFRPQDLIIFGVGIGLTLLLLFFVPQINLFVTILLLLPALICAFLVLPVPNYHNVLCLIQSVLRFFTERKVFLWKGWCVNSGKDNK